MAQDFMTPAELLSTLHRMNIQVLERGWLSSNNVVIRGPDHCAVIDTGYATHAEQTLALVRSTLGHRELTAIANTHLHSDHCGGNALLHQAYPEARRLIPPGQARAVGVWDTDALTYGPTGQVCPRFGFDGLLLPGNTASLGDLEWQVLAATGHDPHSIVLFEPNEKLLISADALWENGFGIVFPELDNEAAFDEVSRTLDLIEALEPRGIIPGHGRVFSDLNGALMRARERLEMFIKSPVRHRRHALKVLIKFKMLEWQSCEWTKLCTWFESSSYFTRIALQDSSERIPDQLDRLVKELCSVRALQLDGSMVLNA